MIQLKIVDDSPDFVQRVMKENLWTESYTLRVIEEYKRFLWLARSMSVAPSYEIDQVWHTHILFSEDYTSVCKKLFGKYLHHRPESKSSPKKCDIDPYILTLAAYELEFGNYPKDIWTNWIPMNCVYLDLNRHWVIGKRSWLELFKLLLKYTKHEILRLVVRKK